MTLNIIKKINTNDGSEYFVIQDAKTNRYFQSDFEGFVCETAVTAARFYNAKEAKTWIENYAKKDPRYSEFQTANVFGDALVKALGLKA